MTQELRQFNKNSRRIVATYIYTIYRSWHYRTYRITEASTTEPTELQKLALQNLQNYISWHYRTYRIIEAGTTEPTKLQKLALQNLHNYRSEHYKTYRITEAGTTEPTELALA